MTDAPDAPNPLAASRRAAPPEVWAQVRDDYLAGMSATEACRRQGVSIGAMRDRAAREGWRRKDQPWAPANRLDADDEGVMLEDRADGDLDRIDLPELAWVARRRMMRAVLRGDAAEALRWRRVRMAMDDEDYDIQRLTGQQDSLRHERTARRTG